MNKVKRLVLDKLALSRGQLSEYDLEPKLYEYVLGQKLAADFLNDHSNYWYWKGVDYVCRELLKVINETEIESALNDIESDRQIKEFMKE